MKRVWSLAVSVGILAVMYWKIDVTKLLQVLSRCEPGWLVLSLSMVVPLTALTAYRFQVLMPQGATLTFRESLALILSASAMNMVLPSKMGDVAKSAFLKEQGHLGGAFALALVIFEKGCDMLALLAWCVLGLLVLPKTGALFWTLAAAVALGSLVTGLVLLCPPVARAGFTLVRRWPGGWVAERVAPLQAGWEEMSRWFGADRARQAYIAALSLLIWFLHLIQIWLFIVALGASVPFAANLGLSPLAILAGLLPLTFAGVGTRDAALVVLYAPYLAAATAAALGLLCTSRYLIPALAGVPFLHRHLGELRRAR